MYVFGFNVPLVELLVLLSIIFIALMIYFGVLLQKLVRMSKEEVAELQELQDMAEDDKKIEEDLKGELEQLQGVEVKEEVGISKFETEMGVLEESTETLYLKRLIPDVYKLQNYILWALKKGIPIDQIKVNLADKGWKDQDLIEMVVQDMSSYVDYYKNQKGAKIPSLKIDKGALKRETELFKKERIKKEMESLDLPKEVVLEEKSAKKKPKKESTKKAAKKPSEKPSKKPSKKKTKKKDELTSVEQELKELEEDLAKAKVKTKKKSASKKPAKKKTSKKSSAKTKSSKKSSLKKKSKPTAKKRKGADDDQHSIIAIDGDEDFDLDVHLK